MAIVENLFSVPTFVHTMMKKLILLSLATTTAFLAACSSNPSEKQLAMANPASKYCLEQRGKLRPLKNAYGDESINCKLPHGHEQDEWDLYRQTHP